MEKIISLVLVVGFINCLILNADCTCVAGTSTPASKSSSLDSNTDVQYIITKYTSSCCGFVTNFTFYPMNTGTIVLQIWRPLITNVYQLVGKFTFFVAETNTNVEALVSDEIAVNTNDIIGWYTAGTDMIPYRSHNSEKDGNIQLTGTGEWSVGQNYSLATTYINDRSYAIKATISNSVKPYFTNIGATIDVYDQVTSGTTLYTVQYTDDEASDVSTLVLSLLSMTPATANINFDLTTGVVSTTGPLYVGTITLRPRIVDRCGESSNAYLYINVLNYVPVIHNLPGSGSVSEMATLETLLYNLTVSDNSGDAVTCFLSHTSPASAPFLVKYITGTTTYGIFSQASPGFNYGNTQQYDLTINCTDGKDTASELFSAYILNNNAPTITNLPATVTIATDTTPGTVIYKVTAEDVNGDNIRFWLSNCYGTCYFSLTSDGDVLTITSLESLGSHTYELEVGVTDERDSQRVRLSIVVSGVNNQPFFINMPRTLGIEETTSVGTTVFTVSVSNNDNDNLHYQVEYTPASAGVKFAYDTSTGHVTVAEVLDYESNVTQYALSILVSDGFLSAGPANLTIDVLNVNEPPVFSRSSYIILDQEERTIGYTLSTPDYQVTDPDFSETQTYSLVGVDYMYVFTMDPNTAELTINVNYDIDNNNFPTFLYYTVQVTDNGGLTGTASLTVYFADTNDNDPVFSHYTYEATVECDIGIGTGVLYVTAVDADYGSNGAFQYELVSGTYSSYFRITTSGLIYLVKSISVFGNYTTMDIQVMADGGGNRNRGYTQVYIVVTPASSDEAFFDNPANVAWVIVVIFLCVGLLGFFAFAMYRLYHHGYIFTEEKCFNKRTSKVEESQKRPRVLESAFQKSRPQMSIFGSQVIQQDLNRQVVRNLWQIRAMDTIENV